MLVASPSRIPSIPRTEYYEYVGQDDEGDNGEHVFRQATRRNLADQDAFLT